MVSKMNLTSVRSTNRLCVAAIAVLEFLQSTNAACCRETHSEMATYTAICHGEFPFARPPIECVGECTQELNPDDSSVLGYTVVGGGVLHFLCCTSPTPIPGPGGPPVLDVCTPTNLDVYLLIGQSNMSGRAPINTTVTQDTAPIPNTWLLDGNNTWEPASNPLNRHSTNRKSLSAQRIGPGYAFALRIQQVIPGHQIGLVVQARGGTSISQWEKGGSLYENAVAKALAAVAAGGTLRAILWHQGESDADEDEVAAYLGLIATMIANLRADLGIPDLPFVAGQLIMGVSDFVGFNNMIIDLPSVVNYTAVVLTDNQVTTNNNVHFDRHGQLELGRRYAEALLPLL